MALAAEALRLAYLNPGVPGVIGAPTYPMLRDVTRAAFLDLLATSGVPHVFRKADNEVYLLEPQSLVRFRSLDNPTRLVGSNLAWFGVDELTYCKEDSWRRLEARLRHPKAKHLEGFAAWTPKGFDWVYERFIGESRVQGYDAIVAKPRENKALPPDFYDRLKASYDARFFEQEALGKYLSIFAGQVYYAFDRAHNVRAVQFDPKHPICWSMDFNVNPMASVLCQVVDGELRVLQEIVIPNSNTPESCRVFRDRIQPYLDILRGNHYAAVPLRVSVYGDAAGNQRKSSADRTDWKIVRDFFDQEKHILQASFFSGVSNPTVKGRVNAMNALLCNADGERRLFADPACRELIADLEQVAWRTDSAGNSVVELDKSNPKRTHVSDAIGYLAEREFGLRPVGGPRPQYLGV
ncbi:hypothetical protein UFOVP130_19 [uncultured Caudovirales phage]|uniref:Uncharacterized protein n=1 Tax=uncultured Caudovirales phage TaxID=2100421 RepID=A0A6J5LBQ8_9CAUD|nr:hypothetical protein UFOVP130_19 [uncultured Caudovirales phage]